ncbi:hypothetical protein OIU79_019443 [Salix purpurea]|uniref:Uncharacterized protein n=1 Tax=Salix purpurea TaxID=77065 RepID=A0A9Q0P1N8_SALPP|nr:hypothetical protein OIU79_019443 [Salix purpurea]
MSYALPSLSSTTAARLPSIIFCAAYGGKNHFSAFSPSLSPAPRADGGASTFLRCPKLFLSTAWPFKAFHSNKSRIQQLALKHCPESTMPKFIREASSGSKKLFISKHFQIQPWKHTISLHTLAVLSSLSENQQHPCHQPQKHN